MNKLMLLAVVIMSGCASNPYLEVGLTYSFEFSTDYWVHPDRSWQCEPPGIDVELGLEWSNKFRVALYHESTILCGSWNHKPEIFENGVRISKTWGGWYDQ